MILTLLKYWYIPVVAAGAVWATHKVDSMSYSRLQAIYASYQVHVAQQHAKDEANARETLQKRIDDQHETEVKNDRIISALQARVSTAQRDRALAQRLLASARNGGGTCSGAVPETPGEPGTPDPSAGTVAQGLGSALAATFIECRANAAQLNALIQEVKPQL